MRAFFGTDILLARYSGQVALQAFDKHKMNKDISTFIKKEYEKKCGTGQHLTVRQLTPLLIDARALQ